MKISELAGRLNISPRAIRYYEEKGSLSPRKDNGADTGASPGRTPGGCRRSSPCGRRAFR
ncbi:MerR family transcriptional regulator [Paenibacillus sp. P26]|nr:MerR family transcriptional regulator [Paenibacillus sp. P26]